MINSPKKPAIFGVIALLLSAICWLLQQPSVDTRQWNEKMWSVHRVNHLTEDWCMTVFALSAILFFVVAFYRWIKSKKEPMASSETLVNRSENES